MEYILCARSLTLGIQTRKGKPTPTLMEFKWGKATDKELNNLLKNKIV